MQFGSRYQPFSTPTGASNTEVLPSEPWTALPQLNANAVGEKAAIPKVSANASVFGKCCWDRIFRTRQR